MIQYAPHQSSAEHGDAPGSITWEPVADAVEAPEDEPLAIEGAAHDLDGEPHPGARASAGERLGATGAVERPAGGPAGAGGRSPERERGAALPAGGSWSEADLAAIAASLGRVPFNVQSLGPVGRRRSIAMIVLRGLVTLGLATPAWASRANREMAEFDPRMQVRHRRTGTALLVPPLLLLGVAAAAAARLLADHLGHGPGLPVAASLTRWLVFAPVLTPLLTLLLPMSLVGLVMTLERVRVVEDRAGVDPERQLTPSRLLVWLVCPLVGTLVIAAVAQRRLNRIWAASG